MTETQLYFHISQGKTVIIPIEWGLIFIQKNEDLEESNAPYIITLQENYDHPVSFFFDEEKMAGLISQMPDFLENAELGEIQTIDFNDDFFLKAKFKIGNTIKKMFGRFSSDEE